MAITGLPGLFISKIDEVIPEPIRLIVVYGLVLVGPLSYGKTMVSTKYVPGGK
jgi:Na+-transporting NADH:ubiquinone oxidoreductase subunit NqrD